MRTPSFNKKRSVLRVRFPYHGGLTPAALDSVVGVRRTWFAAPSKRDTLPKHGGLTPAALGCVFASPRTLLDSHRTAFAFSNHGGLTPAALDSALVVRRKLFASAQQARPVTEPRRADARRSCRTCVCAPRMSLFFSGPASCTRSGWRKPAVVVKRFARAKRSRTFATIRMRPPRAAPGAAGVG
jgi:hypothetical protein